MSGKQERCWEAGCAPMLLDTLGEEGSALWCPSLHEVLRNMLVLVQGGGGICSVTFQDY